MSEMTRRQFLERMIALGAAGAGEALMSGGCAPRPAPAEVTKEEVPPPTGAYLAVARGGEPEEITRRAIEAIGGMRRFVKKGDDVIVKPNICVAYHTFEYAATTNPDVVATLVKLSLEAGARRVRVMDRPFGGTPQQAYERSGIKAAVEAAGGEMEVMSPAKFTQVAIPDGRDLDERYFYGPVLEADALINVPVAKHHNLARLTLGMKNLLGVILDPSSIHANLGQRVADLTSLLRPDLTVVDAVRILTNHGPTGGSLDDVLKLDTVIASHDIVATDAYATTLFDKEPSYVSYVTAGAEMGLGKMELDELEIEEIAV
jgi:uncharacterized protein (DUF362 family)